jgi:hypothetical protein
MQGDDDRESAVTRLAALIWGVLAAGVEMPDAAVAVALLAAVLRLVRP